MKNWKLFLTAIVLGFGLTVAACSKKEETTVIETPPAEAPAPAPAPDVTIEQPAAPAEGGETAPATPTPEGEQPMPEKSPNP